VAEAPDGLAIEGAPGAAVRARVDTAGDHRLALAFGALGATTGGVVLSDATVVRKSWPGFFEALALVTRHPDRPGAE
jgi:3-phosphoshikimate 1-carboxyvinyltransferase